MNPKFLAIISGILMILPACSLPPSLFGDIYGVESSNPVLPNEPMPPEDLSANAANASVTQSSVKIASWNLQIFGDSKASNPELMKAYADIIGDYDVIFLQEIRDSDNSSFNQLCAMLQPYNCKISSRAGRSSSKEQYGLLYKKEISILEFIDYNPDAQDRWERPPIEVTFLAGNLAFTAYNIHTKPQNASLETENLENAIENTESIVVLGDMNLDCDYYNANPHVLSGDEYYPFKTWESLIKYNQDTTAGQTNCAYDRIFVNEDMKQRIIGSGIRTNTTPDMSDHYPIWMEIG